MARAWTGRSIFAGGGYRIVPKAKAHPDQVAFDFEAPAPRKGRAELAGLERRINETVGTMLNSARLRNVTVSNVYHLGVVW